jgi:hypothetical protein
MAVLRPGHVSGFVKADVVVLIARLHVDRPGDRCPDPRRDVLDEPRTVRVVDIGHGDLGRCYADNGEGRERQSRRRQ